LSCTENSTLVFAPYAELEETKNRCLTPQRRQPSNIFAKCTSRGSPSTVATACGLNCHEGDRKGFLSTKRRAGPVPPALLRCVSS